MRGGGKAPHVRVAKPAAQAPAGLGPKGRRAAGRLRPVAPGPTPRGVMSSTPRLFPRHPVRRRRRGKRRGRRPEGGSLTGGLTRRDVWSRTPCACRARGSKRRPMPTVIRVQGLRQTRSRCSHVREACRIPRGRSPGGKEGAGGVSHAASGRPTRPLPTARVASSCLASRSCPTRRCAPWASRTRTSCSMTSGTP